MKYIFNSNVLKHNLHSDFDGDYRLKKFEENCAIYDIKDIEKYTLDKIGAVHDKDYIQYIKQSCLQKSQLAETDLNIDSYNAMIISAYLSIKATKQNDFAIIRPGGHHAKKSETSGFCFFNNVAIATMSLINQGKKVCIIDIDGHHGDGTQDIFKDNNNVMFVSLHQNEAFPFTGQANDIGIGESFKKVINIPLKKFSSDKLFLESILFAIKYIKQFEPDTLAISAGFDGFEKDKLLKLGYTSRGYYEVGKIFRSLNIQTFAIMEGGYHENIEECVNSFIDGFNNESYKYNYELSETPDDECIDHFEEVKKIITDLYND